MDRARVIIGIDPGFGRMGYAIVEASGFQAKARDFGVISTSGEADFPLRLKEIYRDLCSIIEKHSPELMGIERLYIAKNKKTAMRVAEARGVAILAAAQANIPVIGITPKQVKSAITGDGSADKLSVQQMVTKLLNLKRIPRPDDAADALAIAITVSTMR